MTGIIRSSIPQFLRNPAFGLFLVPMLLFAACAVADERLGGDAVAVKKWDRWEGVLRAGEPAGSDVDVTVRLTSPGGREHVVSAFWDGEDTWRVRFMPGEAGTWSYRTTSQPNVSGLDGQEGRFECLESEGEANRFLRHGPVKVAASGRYFEHTDGTPFFWLGDTAWNGVLMSLEKDWEVFLRDRAEKRFSAIQFVTTQWRAGHTNLEGEVAYTGFENIEINPVFFKRIDERIAAINGHGLLAVPVMLWTLGKPENNPGQLPEDQAIRLARYLVARYGAHHVAWFLPGDGRFLDEEAERWKRIGRAVFSGTDHAPVTLHPRGMQWPFDGFLDENWVSFFGYQSGHGDNEQALQWIHSGPPSEKWKLDPTRPVINLEPPYEDHIAYHSKQPHSAYNIRRAVYWSLLNAPPAGVVYGAHGIWSWEITPAVPLEHPNTGVARPWREAMAFAGSLHMKYVAELFTSLPWWELRPQPDLLAAQPGQRDGARHISVSRTDSGGAILAYLPAGAGELRFKNGVVKGLEARWYNPRTGEWLDPRPGDSGRFVPPDAEDWVLLLRRS